MSKRRRVSTILDAAERAALRRVRRYVKMLSGADSDAQALRFLVRNWKPK